MVPSPSSTEDLICCLALFFTPRLGDVTYKRLMNRFGAPSIVFQASDSELRAVKGMRPEIIQGMRQSLKSGRIAREVKLASSLGIEIIGYHDERYPSLLKEIYDPPQVLYVKGSLVPDDECAVAVVGTRTPSSYGLDITRSICSGLAERGVTVVSGLARGIDGMAHRSALDHGGRTVAVLGCGCNVIYPPEHSALFADIAGCGAVISEFPFDTEPMGMNFPKRNRIISGLTLGTVVVEAAERSGSLITAQMALDQNREVFAVPGSTRSARSRGTNRLIKSGAKLVESAEDILEDLNNRRIVNPRQMEFTWDTSRSTGVPVEMSEQERLILKMIDFDPVHVDEILRATGLAPGDMAAGLLSLELKGLIEEVPGNLYSRKK
ncbi:MAG: DNA-protecting protein DprA [Deltaproteobacteria bacterium]|nr:DNA-protecting protein DprA [Deltaproteobacteria bacterium]